MTKLLFWDFEGALAGGAPDWRLADGALDTLQALSEKGWSHVVVAQTEDISAFVERLGLSAHVARTAEGPLSPAIEAARPFDEAFVIGSGAAVDAARSASLPSILVGDASPLAQFCVETLLEIPLALDTWNSMRRSFFLD
jgi:hypothetical protein